MITLHWVTRPMSLWLLGGLLLFCTQSAGETSSSAKSSKKTSPTPAKRELSDQGTAPLLLDDGRTVAAKKPAQRKISSRELSELFPSRWGKREVGLEVLVDGKPLNTVSHQGKTYLPVPRLGMEYEIRVWNHGSRRVTAVVSVDGLSVINGQSASEDHPGYILAPSNSVLIKGWRRNLDTVAAFRFVERDKSYAHLIGKPENIGVIGLVAIEELSVRPLPELEKKDASVPSAKALRGEVGSIGTEYGREIDSRVYYVPFVRSGNKQSITLYYDTVEALRAAGVPVDRPDPVPFPGDLKFVPPPPGYQGK